MDDEGFLDDRAHAHARIERFGGILEDHLEIPAQRTQRPLAGAGDVGAAEVDGAGGGFEQADDGLAEGGFAAAGFADEAEGFAGSDVQRDAVHGAHGAGLAQHDAAAHREVDAQLRDG